MLRIFLFRALSAHQQMSLPRCSRSFIPVTFGEMLRRTILSVATRRRGSLALEASRDLLRGGVAVERRDEDPLSG